MKITYFVNKKWCNYWLFVIWCYTYAPVVLGTRIRGTVLVSGRCWSFSSSYIVTCWLPLPSQILYIMTSAPSISYWMLRMHLLLRGAEHLPPAGMFHEILCPTVLNNSCKSLMRFLQTPRQTFGTTQGLKFMQYHSASWNCSTWVTSTP